MKITKSKETAWITPIFPLCAVEFCFSIESGRIKTLKSNNSNLQLCDGVR